MNIINEFIEEEDTKYTKVMTKGIRILTKTCMPFMAISAVILHLVFIYMIITIII